MPGRLLSWPDWPEFTAAKAEPGDDPVGYKRTLAEKYGKENIIKSWLKLCQELESVTDRITEHGSSAIPEVTFEEVFDLSPERRQALKGRWPAETPFILNLYYSPTQMAARSRLKQLKLSKELNSCRHDKPGSSYSLESLSYADGIRIRPPGVTFRGLGPHVDARSLCRWADPTYQSVCSAVFSGHLESLANCDLSARQHANQAMFPGSAHSRVFRVFQGWTALTFAGLGEGSLMLYPNVIWTVAYLLLPPFFRAPEAEADVMDVSKWSFDVEDPWFPGTFRDDSQLLSPTSHPHLWLRE
ncbi:hypothetical protein A1O7_05345 [Cladophialophora yegresii CBS 114405]|uniref:Uncharacterized protein n=1 Tax=Cladophialophora yegresii CBS 114405 TaxID=1182544 RepID=W9VQE2_9EURO|nr:uncharacterized protein A1O7_05345 [Cladophialophora yegresii CBS 114405]EXJ57922.1 hypothetical protein A1O7_05345 [Cladophialophora yegresii CBS 114405]